MLIADEQSVYAPRDYNDQVLLGLKGTMAEAETVWMRRWLQGGKLSKARRGELFFHPPVGYVWDPVRERFALDPDEQVQRAVQLGFERFRIEGTARGVLRYFVSNRLEFPVRRSGESRVRWGRPAPGVFRRMLHNPTYAGTYVYGRCEERAALVDGVFPEAAPSAPAQRGVEGLFARPPPGVH